LRIAIVGAGLSGLSCAHELERLGFAPTIFEKNRGVGDGPPRVETMAQFLHIQPRQDIFGYLREELHLPVNPAGAFRRAVLHSPSQEATLTGDLGYVTIRGDDDRSLERQLARHLHSPIRFGEQPDVMGLAETYDWVVVANGDRSWAAEFLQWETDVVWSVQGALVRGDFFPGELHFFFNSRYAGTGYALISACDERTASVGVGMPQATAEELGGFWETFRREQGHRWEAEELPFRMERLECGHVRSNVLGNVLLVGVAGGFMETLGLTGQCAAMSSGVYAARQIVLGDRSLERFARRWRVSYLRTKRLRQLVNTWTDEGMDWFVRAMHYGGRVVTDSPWNLLRPAGLVADWLRQTGDGAFMKDQ
jgi:digeranylgeranylglycerophospholipid reductase